MVVTKGKQAVLYTNPLISERETGAQGGKGKCQVSGGNLRLLQGRRV